ncbi:hypothetical protein [Sorangium cellulosum]|uniref:hypothetical protein n=1 Tax=Sorangium cellulosum TaxID=56 RepID=UPI0005D205A2|nr:hypothetical protein [Sorangium cellulosum]
MTDPPLARIGGAEPLAAADVPSLVLAIHDASEVPSGVGNLPKPTQRRPLAVTTIIDLTDPTLHFPDGDVALFAEGGRVLRLPHALVHPDGTSPPPPFDGAALRLTLDGTELAWVPGAPGPQQFSFDPAAAAALDYGDPDGAGVVRFDAPLTGTELVARYFVGEYELTAARYRGVLALDVVAPTAAEVDDLSQAVATALRRGALSSLGTAHGLVPTGWGAIGLAETALGGARRRTLTYRFDLEVEEAVLPTGGGRIARVDVTTALDPGKRPPPPLPTDTGFSVVKREETP